MPGAKRSSLLARATIAAVQRARLRQEPPHVLVAEGGLGVEAAVAADGMAVKVVRGGTARWSHLFEHGFEGVGHLNPHLRLWRRLRPAGGANGHKTESTPP